MSTLLLPFEVCSLWSGTKLKPKGNLACLFPLPRPSFGAFLKCTLCQFGKSPVSGNTLGVCGILTGLTLYSPKAFKN